MISSSSCSLRVGVREWDLGDSLLRALLLLLPTEATRRETMSDLSLMLGAPTDMPLWVADDGLTGGSGDLPENAPVSWKAHAARTRLRDTDFMVEFEIGWWFNDR